MSNVSVADILKIHGKWIESSEFIESIRDKLKISERQAYRLVKRDKQILKLVLSDRTVLYGLPEFGLPSEVKSSKFGLFEWLNKRAERKRKEKEKIDRTRLLEQIHYRELLAEHGGEEWAIMKKIAEKDREILKELDKEV